MKKTLYLILFFKLALAVDAQPVDSICYLVNTQRFAYAKLIVPTGLIAGGFIFNNNSDEGVKKEIAEERNEWIPNFKTHVDDYLQFSPFVVAYGLDFFGVPSHTDRINRTVILVKGELAMLSATYLGKNLSKQTRPDGSDDASFPSGHTAQAFAAAAFLSEEYKERYHWMPYLSYGVASAVGCLRIANNKHYLSDVLVGAGIGILSMKLAYWTHQYKWGRPVHVKTISLD